MGTPAAKHLPQTWTKGQLGVEQLLELKRKKILVPSGVWAAQPLDGFDPTPFPERLPRLPFPPPLPLSLNFPLLFLPELLLPFPYWLWPAAVSSE